MMELIAVLALVAIVAVAALLRNTGARGRQNDARASAPSLVNVQGSEGQPSIPPERPAERDWLARRWQDAGDALARGDTSSFPAWYFDSPTERQLDRLRRSGVLIPPNVTKGQASDLIGLGEEPDEDDAEILKFFKVSTREMSQTRARAEVARIFSDPANKHRWETRRASSLQKQHIQFLGGAVPKGITAVEADVLLADLSAREPERQDAWDSLQAILEEFDDADFRESVGIKKPNAAELHACIDKLVAEGHSLEDLAPEDVADKLIETNPRLARD